MVPRVVYYVLQPLIIIAVLAFWWTQPGSALVYPIAIGALHVLLATFEYRYPARADWLQPWREKLQLICIAVVLVFITAIVAGLYHQWLSGPLGALRASFGLDIWPHEWPLLVQVFMVFFASEFIWYWLHRAEHRWSLVWRVSGHGAHHSFKNLGAINFGANHPLETLWLVLPSALVELTFGVGIAAAGASLLVAVQASIAHANLRLNSRYVGWLFTTNRHHIHHHSMVIDESNTNYGCAAIVWDRVFGTFADADTQATGIGPTEPGLWAKLIMPVREPFDSQIAPK